MNTAERHPDLVTAYLLAQAGLALPFATADRAEAHPDEAGSQPTSQPTFQPASQPGMLTLHWQ